MGRCQTGKLLIFSLPPFISPCLKMMCGTRSRKNVSESEAWLSGTAASLSFFYTAIINVLFVVKLSMWPTTETWSASNLN